MISRETQARLDAHLALLRRWNAKINLVAKATLAEAQSRHLADSAQLAPLIPDGARTLVDLGSGAGFPGLVLAILRPDLAVTLVDSDARKIAFLREAVRETGAGNVRVHHGRVEALTLPPPDILTARAFAPLESFLSVAAALIGPDTLVILPKGKSWQSEIDIARQAGHEFVCEPLVSRTEPEARILCLSAGQSQ